MAIIELKDLCKSFGDLVVLDGINLSVEKGESLAIIGASGTGKSVMLKHIIGLMAPDSGEVFFDGENVAELSDAELVEVRRRIGMLFQSAALFDSMTVEENVGLGLKESRKFSADEIRDIVQEKLELVDLAGAGEKLPSELSGGMKKRVGLARAIANDPEVLLYDEPTTGLDPIIAEMINELIARLNDRLSVTSLSVTHDMKSAFHIADRVVMLHKGRIHFDGTTEELKKSQDKYVRDFIDSAAYEA
jgi:phospholipid/cholesterol/gamma-HCH transport system ATP-binding protein